MHCGRSGSKIVEDGRKLESIQLVTISCPSAYGEYVLHHFVETEQEFEEAVKNM